MKVAWSALCALSLSLPSRAIDTVPSLDVTKYIGRWYMVYGNHYTSHITMDNPCVVTDYGLDQATGNVTANNSCRDQSPTAVVTSSSGYAYGTDPSEPGQMKIHLGGIPVDRDYWVIELGPDTFGPYGAYEWALVSDRKAELLFTLVRDVEQFEEKYESDVLALIKELGFTGQDKEPKPVVQKGCIPIPVIPPSTNKAQKKLDWFDALATMETEAEAEAAAVEVEDGGPLSSVLGLRGGALGLGRP